MQDDCSAEKNMLVKRIPGERESCLQVYRRQRCKQVHVDNAAGQRVPELRREGLCEGHEETINFDKCWGGLDEVVAGHAWNTRGIWLHRRVTQMAPQFVPAVEDLDLREQQGGLNVQNERVGLLFQVRFDDVRIVRPLPPIWGN